MVEIETRSQAVSVLVYCLVSMTYIILSDNLLFGLDEFDLDIYLISIFKGLMFVILTSVYFLFTLNKKEQQLSSSQKQLEFLESQMKNVTTGFELLVENLPVFIWVVNQNRQYVFASGKSIDVLDISTKDLLGKKVGDIAADYPFFIKATDQVLEGKEISWVEEIEGKIFEGHYIPHQIDNLRFGIGITLDITQREYYQQELSEKREIILKAVELHQKGEIANKVFHDLNNYLLLNLNYCQEIMDISQDASITKITKNIQSISNEMRYLPEMLLNRHEESGIDVVDVSSFLKDREEFYRSLLGTRITFKAEICSESTPVRLRKNRLNQVLVNLLLNASDAIDQTGEIILRTIRTGDNVTITVEDNGSGFPPEKADRLFDQFYTTKSKGNGLGLYIVSDLVETWGGEIRALREGGWTKFIITLPLVTLDHPDIKNKEEN